MSAWTSPVITCWTCCKHWQDKSNEVCFAGLRRTDQGLQVERRGGPWPRPGWGVSRSRWGKNLVRSWMKCEGVRPCAWRQSRIQTGEWEVEGSGVEGCKCSVLMRRLEGASDGNAALKVLAWRPMSESWAGQSRLCHESRSYGAGLAFLRGRSLGR